MSLNIYLQIDAIGQSRTNSDYSGGVQKRVLTTLLNELDGIESGSNQGVYFLAATNRLETVDSALTRPGRIDMILEVGYPNEQDIREIVEKCFCNSGLEVTDLVLNGVVTCANVVQKCTERVMDKLRADNVFH